MNVPNKFTGNLDRIEQTLNFVVNEFPKPSALARVKSALALLPTPSSMNVPEEFTGKFHQIEQNLKFAVGEFPQPSALDRVAFALALIQFIRTQLVLNHDAATQSARNPEPHKGRHDPTKT
jgi:hypothetical protein